MGTATYSLPIRATRRLLVPCVHLCTLVEVPRRHARGGVSLDVPSCVARGGHVRLLRRSLLTPRRASTASMSSRLSPSKSSWRAVCSHQSSTDLVASLNKTFLSVGIDAIGPGTNTFIAPTTESVGDGSCRQCHTAKQIRRHTDKTDRLTYACCLPGR